jgi:hypothetical protein
MPKEMTRAQLLQWPLILLLTFSIILLQAGLQAGPNARSVVTGAWGGEHMILEISARDADVEFDCAHGEVAQPITLDKQGDFDVAGTFTPEHGGPVRRDEETPSASARYSGHVDGDSMRLKVTVGKETMGVFTLTRGSRPILRKCR